MDGLTGIEGNTDAGQVDRRAERWMDGCNDGRMDGWREDGWKEVWEKKRRNGCNDGRKGAMTGGRMGGCNDGRGDGRNQMLPRWMWRMPAERAMRSAIRIVSSGVGGTSVILYCGKNLEK